LRFPVERILVAAMIQGGFLSKEDRGELIALARDGSAACRVTRRANALVLLDDGWSCQQVAHAFLLDDDTVRGWRKLFEQRGIEGLTCFDVGGNTRYLSAKQEDDLKACVGATLSRSTRRVGVWIEPEFGQPLGTDRALASSWARISRAESHPAQARRREAKGVYREL
jgi:transposase